MSFVRRIERIREHLDTANVALDELIKDCSCGELTNARSYLTDVDMWLLKRKKIETAKEAREKK